MRLLALALLLLAGCGLPYYYPSLLRGTSSYFQYGQNVVSSSITFDRSGTFIYEQTYPSAYSCSSSGTWVDLNAGATTGSVRLTYTSDTCNTSPSLYGTSQTYTYTIAGYHFSIAILLGNIYTQLSD
jgi:hypothetical protein